MLRQILKYTDIYLLTAAREHSDLQIMLFFKLAKLTTPVFWIYPDLSMIGRWVSASTLKQAQPRWLILTAIQLNLT